MPWKKINETSSASSIGGLSDVDFSTLPIDGNVLTYNGSTSKWEPEVVTGAGASAGETYVVELARWNIKNDGTDAINTTKGINDAFIWASQSNYGIVILPAGTYLIDKDSSVQFLSNTHYKMYGALFIKDANDYSGYETLECKNVKNVTLEGGKLKGDRELHTYTAEGTTHEWGVGLAIRYSCVNILVKNIDSYEFTGDGAYVGMDFNALGGMQHHVIWTTGTAYAVDVIVNNVAISKSYKCIIKGSGTSTIQPSHDTGIVALADGYSWQYNGVLTGTHFSKGDIDPATGNIDATKTDYTTVNKFFDVTGTTVKEIGYVYYAGDGFGGYGTGMNLNKVPIKVHFYKNDNTYLGSRWTRSYEFTYLESMPLGTQKIRYSYYQNYDLMSGNLHYVMCARIPHHITFYNCRFFRNRRLGTAAEGRYLTYDSCQMFDNATPMPVSTGCWPAMGIDIEDGYHSNQKITLRNCRIYDNHNGGFMCVSTRGVYLVSNTIYGGMTFGGQGDDYYSNQNSYYGGLVRGGSITSGVEKDGTYCIFRNDSMFNASASGGGNITFDGCVFTKSSLTVNGGPGNTCKIFNCKMTTDKNNGALTIGDGAYVIIRDSLFDLRGGTLVASNCDYLEISNCRFWLGDPIMGIAGGTLTRAKTLVMTRSELINRAIEPCYLYIYATENLKIENTIFKNHSMRITAGGLGTQIAKDYGYVNNYFKNNRVIWDLPVGTHAHEAMNPGVSILNFPRLEVTNNKIEMYHKGTNLPSHINFRVYVEEFLNFSNNVIATYDNIGGSTTSSKVQLTSAYRAAGASKPFNSVMINKDNEFLNAGSIEITNSLKSQLGTYSYGSTPPVTASNAEPTTGQFKLGQEIKNLNPVAGGYLGWVCTTEGFLDSNPWEVNKFYFHGDRIAVGNKVYNATIDNARTFTDQPTFPTIVGNKVKDTVPAGTLAWTTGMTISANQLIVPTTYGSAGGTNPSPGNHVFKARAAGTTGATEPVWRTDTYASDNGILWDVIKIQEWQCVGDKGIIKPYGLISG
jgi:hypothetical protein